MRTLQFITLFSILSLMCSVLLGKPAVSSQTTALSDVKSKAQQEIFLKIGSLAEIKGMPEIINTRGNTRELKSRKREIYANEKISTGESGSVLLALDDNSTLFLDTNTVVTLTQHSGINHYFIKKGTVTLALGTISGKQKNSPVIESDKARVEQLTSGSAVTFFANGAKNIKESTECTRVTLFRGRGKFIEKLHKQAEDLTPTLIFSVSSQGVIDGQTLLPGKRKIIEKVALVRKKRADIFRAAKGDAKELMTVPNQKNSSVNTSQNQGMKIVQKEVWEGNKLGFFTPATGYESDSPYREATSTLKVVVESEANKLFKLMKHPVFIAIIILVILVIVASVGFNLFFKAKEIEKKREIEEKSHMEEKKEKDPANKEKKRADWDHFI